MGSKDKGKRVSAFAKAASRAKPSRDNGEEFDLGKFRVTLAGVNESDNGSFCFTFNGAGKDAKIGERIQWFSTSGKAAHVSGPVVKSLAIILSGCEDNDTYNDFDPHGEFLDAILAGDFEAAAQLMVDGKLAKKASAALAQLTETEFVIRVTKGGEKDNGGHFKNAWFSAASDDDADDEAPDSEAPDSAPASERPRAAKKVSKRAPVDADDEDEAPESEAPESEAPDSEPEPERRPAKMKKAKRA